MPMESIIIKAIVITVVLMLVTMTQKAHATESRTVPFVVATQGTSHAYL